MKIYDNIIEGTPEELARYKELTNQELNTFKEVSEALAPTEKHTPKYYTLQYPIYKKENGAILKHIKEKIYEDSTGNRYSVPNDCVEPAHNELLANTRFNFTKQLNILLRDTTDFAKETKGKVFKVLEGDIWKEGDLAVIVIDDGDGFPLCRNLSDSSRVEYVHLAVLELTKEADIDVTPEEEVIPEYYKVIDNGYTPFVEQGTIVKKIGEDEYTIDFETSTGESSDIPLQNVKRLDCQYQTEDRFNFAKRIGVTLTTDTDFEDECLGYQFIISDSDYHYDDVLYVTEDLGSDTVTVRGRCGEKDKSLTSLLKLTIDKD